MTAANGIRDEGDNADKFGHAVNAFFGNGGNKAYIVRVAETSGAGAPKAATSAIPNPESNTTGFLLTAKSEGAWANDMIARLSTTDKSAVPDVELGYTLELGVLADGKFQALEAFTGLQMDPASARSHRESGDRAVDARFACLRHHRHQSRGNSGRFEGAAGRGDGAARFPRRSPARSSTSRSATARSSPSSLPTTATTPMPSPRSSRARRAPTPAALPNSRSRSAAATRSVSPRRSPVPPAMSPRPREPRARCSASAPGRPRSTTRKTRCRPEHRPIEGFFDGGTDGAATPAKAAYDTVFETIRDYRDISIMLLPGRNGSRPATIR